MTILTTDTFAGLGTSVLDGRTLDNGNGGSGTRTWFRPSGGTGLQGDGAGAIVGTGAGDAGFVSLSTIKKARIQVDPNGATNNLVVYGLHDGVGSPTCIAVILVGGQTSLRVSSFAAGSRTDHATLGITAPGTTFWLELEYSGLTVTARVLNNDTSIRNTVSHTFGSLPSGTYWGFGFYLDGNAAKFDNWLADDGAGGDTTVPTLTGSITEVSKTANSISISWPAGTDNVAVTSYEVSNNAGSSYTDVGNVLAHTFTSLTASTLYALRVRAKDAAGNVSTPALALSVTTLAPDSTLPTWPGGTTLNAGTKTSTSVALTTSAAATDNVGVTGYEWSSDNGATYPFTSLTNSFTFTALTPLTSYNFRVRAYDAAGNRSVSLALTSSTYRAGDTGQNIFDNTGPVGGNPEGFLRNKVTLPADAAKWFSYVITTPPATGSFSTLNPNGTFVFTGPNSETMLVQLEVDGANFGSPFLVTLYDVTSQTATPVNAISIGTATRNAAIETHLAVSVNAISIGSATLSAATQDVGAQIATPVNAISVGTATRNAVRPLSTAPAANRARIPKNGQVRNRLALFYKQPGEFMDYDVDAADYMRAIGDTLASCNVVATPGVDLQAAVVVGQSVKVWTSGGVDKARSKVTVQLVTEGGRIKEVEILILIKET